MRPVFAALLLAAAACALSGNAFPADPAETWHLLSQRQFSELDARLSAYQQRYEKAPASDPEAERDLSQAFRVFYFADADAVGLYDEWIKAFPESYAASLARGECLTALAMKARGSASYRDMTPEQRQAMRLLARRARAELQRSLTLTAKPILSYQFLIEIATITGQYEDKQTLIEAADELDSLNYYPRSAYMFSLQPWWGGSFWAMRQFLETYDKLEPAKWKRDCLEALIVEKENTRRRSVGSALYGLVERFGAWLMRIFAKSPSNDPAEGAPEQLNRAIKLCPTAERFASRAHHWTTNDRPDLEELDLRQALELDPGYVWAQSALGTRLVGQRKSAEGVSLCRLAAERGDGAGQYCLGYAYGNGIGVARDPAEALRWISTAADNGDATAISAMAGRYWRGEGVAADKEKAIELWRAAAKRGSADAKKHLAEVGASP